MKQINKLLDNNISKIVIIFLFSMPFLDLITSLMINTLKFQFNFIVIIKLLFMALFIYYLFFISKTKYKKNSIIYLFLIFIYILSFMIMIINLKGIDSVLYELQNILRNFFYPINLICIFNIYCEKKFNIKIKHISIILLIYILLLFIPTITNLDFSSYAYSKEGSIGWFNSTNEIGAILSILLPISILYLFKLKNKVIIGIILIISIYTYFSIGTKVPILSIMLIMLIFFIKYLYGIIKQKKYKLLGIISTGCALLLILGFFLIPKTSFYKNIVIHLEFLKVDEISDIADPIIIDKFIFSERISYYSKTKSNYLESSFTEKLLGIGYIENYPISDTNTKTIEMDYFDIFFRHGIVGCLLFFTPFIYILWKIFKKLKDATKIDNELLSLLTSIILILILSLFSGHILVAPSVSIFVIDEDWFSYSKL